MTDIVLLEGARTPFTTISGSFRDITATALGVIAAKEAIRKSNINAEDIDQVVFGNVQQSSKDAHLLARHVGLKAGTPLEVPAVKTIARTSSFASNLKNTSDNSLKTCVLSGFTGGRLIVIIAIFSSISTTKNSYVIFSQAPFFLHNHKILRRLSSQSDLLSSFASLVMVVQSVDRQIPF